MLGKQIEAYEKLMKMRLKFTNLSLYKLNMCIQQINVNNTILIFYCFTSKCFKDKIIKMQLM